jgi:hypothetical protein
MASINPGLKDHHRPERLGLGTLSAITGLGPGRVKVPEARWHPFNMLARLYRSSYAFTVRVIAQK